MLTFSILLLLVYLKLVISHNTQVFGRFYALTIFVFSAYVILMMILSGSVGPLSLRYLDESGLISKQALVMLVPVAIAATLPDLFHYLLVKNYGSYRAY